MMTTRFQQNAATIMLGALGLALLILAGGLAGIGETIPDEIWTAQFGIITAIAGIARPGGDPPGAE